MTKELEEKLMLAYDEAKSLVETSEDAEDIKRAIIDDLRSAMDNLNRYEDALSLLSRVEVDISLSAYIYVKHRPGQNPCEAAIRFVDEELTFCCNNACVDVETIDAVRATNMDGSSVSEDMDITDES